MKGNERKKEWKMEGKRNENGRKRKENEEKWKEHGKKSKKN